jgi:hypothetical protein
MEDRVETIPETKQEWIAPELKKIDIEQITAGGTGAFTDGSSYS